MTWRWKCKKKPQPVCVGWAIGPIFAQNGAVTMAALVLKDNQLVKLAVEYVDAKGQAAAAPASPVWAASDDTVLTVKNVSSDGLSAEAWAVGKIGSAQVSVTAGALSAVLDVTVQAGQAVSESIVPGAPEDQPTTA